MKPTVSSGRKFSAIWVIPLVTLVVGVSMVIHSMMTEGPTITLDFATADGLEAGKTKVKLLNVEVGLVESVSIKTDLSGVTATVKLDQEMRSLLVEDTLFWIVRARVGAGGVSGISTILAGAYIEIAPGAGQREQRHFVGLEDPPLTPAEAPGLRLTLFSEHAGSVSAGNAILHRGYKVGRIEAMVFDTERGQVRYDIFVDAPFHELINSATRFWDLSGVSFKLSTSGFDVQTGSLDTILLGGVAFVTQPGLPSGSPVESGGEFKLYESYDDILENPYRYGAYYVVSFDQSLRGLVPGAPVEYRGIEVGRVKRLLVKELVAQGQVGTARAIPVLIYLEPGRLEVGDSKEALERFKKEIIQGVSTHGLRATLETGNLLTGKQLISLDYFPDQEPVELSEFEKYPVIPAIETGVVRLEQQVSTFLGKLNALALEETVVGANSTLESLTATIDSANSLLTSEDVQALPTDLTAMLADLRNVLAGLSQDSKMFQDLGASINSMNTTLESLDRLIRKLSIKPNAILFPTSSESDPIPEARSQ